MLRVLFLFSFFFLSPFHDTEGECIYTDNQQEHDACCHEYRTSDIIESSTDNKEGDDLFPRQFKIVFVHIFSIQDFFTITFYLQQSYKKNERKAKLI